MFRARSANFKVAQVSSNARAEGDTVAMMVVLQLPPRESCNRWVSLESLQSDSKQPCWLLRKGDSSQHQEFCLDCQGHLAMVSRKKDVAETSD